MQLKEMVAETVAYIQSQTTYRPTIAIVLGSGLGQLGEQIINPCIIPYEVLPHWRSSTAPGHQGRLILGLLGGQQVICMQGRLHYYEGYSQKEITYPIRVMAGLGIETLLLSNAAGGIDMSFAPGDLMLITDHINFLGSNPLMGANESDFGVRFCDMSYAYAPELRTLALEAADEIGCKLQQGVYVAATGPSYETPAEIRMFRIWGASAVGMSTVPEVIVANHCGIKIMAVSCITNMAAGILDKPLTEEEVLTTGEKSGIMFRSLIERIVSKLGEKQ